ncbi:enoyl-CoA delta isomerase 1, mitochondrial-like [Topomyia yanbarensis]|uniref:enoyl-CoA delta isomerase 1, mitochondrial-like n=1 Tax=Topomyia yanbarensis TaxID=2498891 RepID=UPI00273CA99B|nr:enoyl-CoA delta isomerase 1, mitochondrial-like [Topomyia yanbarensis]XP_058820012.1 enoyl-CoA delta isomerase 1, mitochondrial-like [Topomyia yanbarensis]
MLRLVTRSVSRKSVPKACSFSNAPDKLVITEVDDKTGYATVTLNRPPVNSLNLELLTAISETLDDLQNNKSRGIILTSSSKTVFSAGLDIMEMYKPKSERLKAFWSTLQDVWFKLYGSPYPTVAAINGHAPAGGCLLSLCCEYRIMCPNYTIGLNETQLGIVAPTWFQASMRNTISRRDAELALTLGTLFTTDEALKVGLIDEVASTKEEALAKAASFLDRFRKISPQARSMTKQALRSKDIMELEDNRSQDVDLFVYAVSQPKVQQSLELYLEALKKKSTK